MAERTGCTSASDDAADVTCTWRSLIASARHAGLDSEQYLRDLCSVRFVVNAAGTGTTPAQALDYDAWGRVSSDTVPGFQPFGFAGGIYDPDTGLVHLGAREYDPETGTWIQRDPLRFGGGVNLYAYASNNPVGFVDPTGLLPCEGQGGASGGGGSSASYGDDPFGPPRPPGIQTPNWPGWHQGSGGGSSREPSHVPSGPTEIPSGPTEIPSEPSDDGSLGSEPRPPTSPSTGAEGDGDSSPGVSVQVRMCKPCLCWRSSGDKIPYKNQTPQTCKQICFPDYAECK
ncbi:RHS repeat-associated core domain-containing protein [Pendulispora brunnea]|uniref:RHS repeat-associated core domain-containing protein n=1 Tax=Pendulispora brunnea TaxID=2905690 RepID=A0ABZ2JYW0_9BACT